ncbi:MAG: ABC transporter ATP-binding protein [Oscillospiraceae bacterium]|nr:ABC transporter ATP-binding protein [Oscillospiraceae bacterium]
MRLEAKGITKQFGAQTALNDVSLSIDHGEFFGLLGTNGAGKTTMIRILSTLMLPTSGRVLADGQELTRSNVEMKKKITVMTQEYTLRNDMSIKEILEYQGMLYHVPKTQRRARAGELMEMTGLWDHRDKLVRHLSGGMKRKVMLCRALLPNPEIILLDEPTVGLDPIFRHQMWDLLRRLNDEGVGFLLTTHYLEEAQQLCKRVSFLNQGRVVTTGAPSEIVGQLGAFCVESAGDTYLFQTQEEALEHLCTYGGKLRDTNLEDVFFRLSGGAV